LSNKQHVLVTGVNGFIGKNLIQKTSLETFKFSGIGRKSKVSEKDYYELDLLDHNAVRELIIDLNPNYVIHLAANKNRDNKSNTYRSIYESNISTAWNVIEACRELPNLKRFIFFGTCDEYGYSESSFCESLKPKPLSFYGLSKLAI
jgi:nucleoside-diphosphate-sugar epimerase